MEGVLANKLASRAIVSLLNSTSCQTTVHSSVTRGPIGKLRGLAESYTPVDVLCGRCQLTTLYGGGGDGILISVGKTDRLNNLL